MPIPAPRFLPLAPRLVVLHCSASGPAQWDAYRALVDPDVCWMAPALQGYDSDARWPVGARTTLAAEARRVFAALANSSGEVRPAAAGAPAPSCRRTIRPGSRPCCSRSTRASRSRWLPRSPHDPIQEERAADRHTVESGNGSQTRRARRGWQAIHRGLHDRSRSTPRSRTADSTQGWTGSTAPIRPPGRC